MDRIINVKVGGNHLSKDNKTAGVKGEGNVTKLRITFDEGWDYYAKTVTFWDATGNNPVKRVQGIDLIEDITKDKRTYLTPIPSEPMAIAGELTFVIDGYMDGKRQRSISDKLIVKDAPMTDNASEPVDPTPTQAEQLQGEIEKFLDDVQVAVIARDETVVYRNEAEGFSQVAKASSEEAKDSAETSQALTDEARGYMNSASASADRAVEAIGHQPVIINGFWCVWSAEDGEYRLTDVKAQAGSEVYYGDNPPAEADVWIDPNGESALYAPYIGENSNWYTFNPETQTFTDSGVLAKGQKGDKGDKGDTYVLTQADKKGIASMVSSEMVEAEVKDALSSPIETIHLSKDVRIESRADGVWLVDRDVETQVYDNESYRVKADYASVSNSSNYASYDEEGRVLKGTDFQEYGDDSYSYVILYDGQSANYGVVDGSIEGELPDEYYTGYISALYFTTPSEMYEDYSTFPEEIHFKGDHTDEGFFVPEADTRYTIVFAYDGYGVNAYVSGVAV